MAPGDQVYYLDQVTRISYEGKLVERLPDGRWRIRHLYPNRSAPGFVVRLPIPEQDITLRADMA